MGRKTWILVLVLIVGAWFIIGSVEVPPGSEEIFGLGEKWSVGETKQGIELLAIQPGVFGFGNTAHFQVDGVVYVYTANTIVSTDDLTFVISLIAPSCGYIRVIWK